jgi:tRNA-dihydrouridine synthase B
MAGVTDAPFRRQVMRYGAGMVYSEMIASHMMIEEMRAGGCTRHRVDQSEFPCAVQLAGCEPDVMAEAARIYADMGVPLIDINFGCPVKKVVNGLGGSALMRDIPRATAIMAAVVRAVNVPVSVKMRLGWDDQSINAPELARIAQDVGVRLITVHGRTRSQLYNGPARWDAVRAVRDVVDLPLFINGDITTPEMAAQAIDESGADGVMVARGAQGRPWVIAQMIAYLRGESVPKTPNLQRIGLGLIDHYDDMIAHYGVFAGNRIARKHIGWTIGSMHGGDVVCSDINQMDDPASVRDAIFRFCDRVRIAA